MVSFSCVFLTFKRNEKTSFWYVTSHNIYIKYEYMHVVNNILKTISTKTAKVKRSRFQLILYL